MMSASTTRFDVFLCHNDADNTAVQVLAERLRNSGLAPFLDTWHLIPGTPWQECVEEALGASSTAAIFLGPSGISPWHNEVMREAVQQAVRSRNDYRVIPVLLPGTDEGMLSGFLARRVWVDFRTGLDDSEALQRMIAGIKGEAFDPGAFQLPNKPAPYRGLFSFEQEHARFFFGRKTETRRLVDKLREYPFVAVVGASGSGKSSLVKAGLLSALENDALPASSEWHTLVVRPGSEPLRRLAEQVALLAESNPQLKTVDSLTRRFEEQPDGLHTAISTYVAAKPQPIVLVIDQLEELFTPCLAKPERYCEQIEPFLANLGDAVQRNDGKIMVVATLRADFYDRCLAYPILRELIEPHQLLLGPLEEEDNLREAIVQPAHEVGAFLEKGLVSVIVHDMAKQPGNLPLLQVVLDELWQARRGPWLTIDAYETSGKVEGALQRRAQAVYDTFTHEQQKIARYIFLRLTAVGEGVPDTRRRVQRSELYPVLVDPDEVDKVVNRLSGEKVRLLVTDEQGTEVAHEALICGWPTLRTWLEEDRDAQRIHRRLTEAARQWAQVHENPDDYLYRGALLTQANIWAQVHSGELNRLERSFLDASQARWEDELKHERRSRKRITALAVVVAVIAILALAAASLAIKLNLDVRAAFAESQRNESLYFAKQAQESLNKDALKSLDWSAMALPGFGVTRPYVPQAEFAATQALSAVQERDYRRVASALSRPQQVAFGWDWIATGGRGVKLVSLDLSEVVTLTQTADVVEEVMWNQDQRFLLARTDTQILVWDISSRELFTRTLDHVTSLPTDQPDAVTVKSEADCNRWRPRSEQILICSGDTLALWTPSQGEIQLLQELPNQIAGARWSEDGLRLAAWDKDDNLQTWDAGSGHFQAARANHLHPIVAAAWAPDSGWLVTASDSVSNTVQIWSADNLANSQTFHVGRSRTDGVEFLDSGRFVTWELNGDICLWSVGESQCEVLDVPDDDLQNVELFRDRTSLLAETGAVTTSLLAETKAGPAILWRVGKQVEPRIDLVGHEGLISSVLWGSPYLITGGLDGTARIWDPTSNQRLVAVLRGHRPGDLQQRADVLGARWLDERHLLTAGVDGSIRRWEVFDGQGMPLCKDNAGTPTCRRFSYAIPAIDDTSEYSWASWLDDTTLLVVDRNGLAGKLFADTGEGEPVPSGCQEMPEACWSPDGRYLLTLAYSPTTGFVQGQVQEVASQQAVQMVPGNVIKAFWLDDSLLFISRQERDELIDLEPNDGVASASSVKPISTASAAALHGDRLAVGRDSGEFEIWNTTHGKQEYRLPDNRLSALSVHDLRWSEDGRNLLVVWPGEVAVWQTTDVGGILRTLHSGDAADHITAIFSPDGRYVIAAVWKDLFVFDLKSGSLSDPLLKNQNAHEDTILGLQWIEAPALPSNAAVSTCHSIVSGASREKELAGPGCRPLLLTWSGDGTARLWHLEVDDQATVSGLIEIWRATDLDMEQYGIDSFKLAAFNDSLSQLLTLNAEGVLRVWQPWVNDPQRLISEMNQLLKPAEERTRLP